MTAAELVIRGGRVADGSGSEPVPADVAIADGAIVAVGRLDGIETARVLDAAGLLVMPGLIDVHSHAAHLLDEPGVAEAHLRQGVTTIVAGQDGLGPAPIGAEVAHWLARYFGAVDGIAPVAGTMADWLGSRDGRALNVAALVPAGSVRAEVVGFEDRPATAPELRRMTALVADAMADGALGLSTGLDYVPGRFASTEELAAIAAPVGEVEGVYASHLRGYGADRINAALAEAREIARLSGARAHASHLHGPRALLEPLLEEGDLTFDSYPYLRGSSILAMVLLPPEVQAGGIDATLGLLGDPGALAALRPRVEADPRIATGVISFAAHPDWRWTEGLGLPRAAERYHGGDVLAFGAELLRACDIAVGAVFENGPDRTEDDMRALLAHPSHLAGSDAILLGSRPHPRGWGAFARLLGRHVRELGDLGWGAAARHLAGHAAERFGLAGRGLVAPGAAADLVVLDPERIADVATYDDPRRPAEGVVHVLVNGVIAVDDGRLTGARAGRALRRAA